jgi:molybdate transport system ATP-binding protein
LEFNVSTPTPIHARFLLNYPAAKNGNFSLDVDLRLPGAGVTAIYGRSGSGKTTLLRCIAGLQKAESGTLIVEGDIWQNEKTFLSTHRRQLGYVFQEASLFAHLSARNNLLYAVKRAAGPLDKYIFGEITELMGIENILEKFPHQLSGGERQRVAIARALMIKPRLLLMDEPLASLDNARKQEIMPYLQSLRRETRIPILYVSHAMDEVARLADHLVVMEHGRSPASGALTDVLAQIDIPLQLGEEMGVIINAEVVERSAHWHLIRVIFDGGELWIKDNGNTLGQSIRVRILARDVSLALDLHEDTSILNRIAVEITGILPDSDAAMSLVKMKAASSVIVARVTRRSVDHLQLEIGAKIWAQIKSVAVVL